LDVTIFLNEIFLIKSMKGGRERGILISLSLIFVVILLSASLISASFFSGIWSKITGEAVLTNNSLSCTDTDNGIDSFIYGSVTSKSSSGTVVVKSDYCSAYDLMEYSCTGKEMYLTNVHCVNGCLDGACIILNYCSDTDGGNGPGQRGTVTGSLNGNSYSYIDTCENGLLREYSCASGSSTYTSSLITCQGGCSNGACLPQSSCVGPKITEPCTETDSGADIYHKGTLSTNLGYSETDYCLSSSMVKEYYCYGNSIATMEAKCSSGCLDGACISSCSGGENISNAVNVTNKINNTNTGGTTTVSTCTDTDGGKNYYILGMVNSTSGSKGSDFCFTNNILEEYFCNSNLSSNVNYTCPYGCENGACRFVPINMTSNMTNTSGATGSYVENNSVVVDPFCNDSDGGKDYFTKGTMRSKYSSDVDFCINSIRLSEYFCNGDFGSGVGYNCPAGCSNGACIATTNSENSTVSDSIVKTSVCTDSDGGKDYYNSGIVDSIQGSNSDNCITKNTLLEYFCDGESFSAITYDCLYGCESGACSRIVAVEPMNVDRTNEHSCEGCVFNGVCYPLGYRKSRSYCSENEKFTLQLGAGEACVENFECSSNVCFSSKCASESRTIRNFFYRFRRIFLGQ
jgi:hypothetical protein